MKFPWFSPPKQAPLQGLQNVHLIVHPGDGLHDNNLEQYRDLLGAMVTRAASINTRNEIAIVLLQKDIKELERLRHSASAQEGLLANTLHNITDALPKNVVLAHAPAVRYSYTINPIFDDVRNRIESLGFAITPTTNVLAYGEMVTQCVPDAAIHFAKHFSIHTPPTIDVNYTDARICDTPAIWREYGIRLGLSKTLHGDALQYLPLEK